MKEVFYISIDEIDLTVQNTQIVSVRRKDIGKTGVREYGDGMIGIAGGLGEVSEKMLHEKAMEALKNGIPYPYASRDRRPRSRA